MLRFHFFIVYPISTLIFNLTDQFGDRIVSKMANFWLFLRVRFALLLSACWAIDMRASMALKLAGLDSVQGGSRARERMWTVVISSKDEGSPHYVMCACIFYTYSMQEGREFLYMVLCRQHKHMCAGIIYHLKHCAMHTRRMNTYLINTDHAAIKAYEIKIMHNAIRH